MAALRGFEIFKIQPTPAYLSRRAARVMRLRPAARLHLIPYKAHHTSSGAEVITAVMVVQYATFWATVVAG